MFAREVEIILKDEDTKKEVFNIMKGMMVDFTLLQIQGILLITKKLIKPQLS